MKKLNIILIVLYGISLLSCDNKKELECYSGTVLNEIPCNSEKGSAFLIKIENQYLIDTIATTTLPESFKINGVRIFFRIRTPEYPLFCTTNIIPPKKEFDVYNASNKSCTDE